MKACFSHLALFLDFSFFLSYLNHLKLFQFDFVTFFSFIHRLNHTILHLTPPPISVSSMDNLQKDVRVCITLKIQREDMTDCMNI